MAAVRSVAMIDPRQRKANLRLGLILATVALAFALGFVVRFVFFAGA
jgi:hypothetical protein